MVSKKCLHVTGALTAAIAAFLAMTGFLIMYHHYKTLSEAEKDPKMKLSLYATAVCLLIVGITIAICGVVSLCVAHLYNKVMIEEERQRRERMQEIELNYLERINGSIDFNELQNRERINDEEHCA